MSEEQAGVSRREVLRRLVGGAAAGLALAGYQAARAQEVTQRQARSITPKAKSVIQIWMWGGPCHLDTFDPKPEAGYDYCGPLDKPIETNVPGIRIGSLLPMLAQQADKFSILRSVTHGNNGHETASYIVQTGRQPGGRLTFPSIGAVVSYFKGYDHGYTGLIPPYIVLTQPQGRFDEAGFLGQLYKPFATGGDPNARVFVVEGVVMEGISEQRQRNRRELLHTLDTLGRAKPNDPRFQQLDACEEKAYEMILGDAGKLFDLSTEKEEVRQQYGRNTFGQSCLMARRLVEAGVPYITINYGGWDTHKQHFETMRRKLPELDRGLATLLADLSARGLLETTIVWWTGEFGRTPKVDWQPPWNGGRSHYGACFSALVAGGGFKGGQVVGSSDAKGEFPQDRPIYPQEILGSMYELLGIDPEGPLRNPQQLDVPVCEPSAGQGLLREIM